jgi:non-ribosomal peptide synthetase component F
MGKPDPIDAATPSTLPAAFQASAARVPERLALKRLGESTGLSWAGYAAAVREAAGALAGAGVRSGDRVALLSRNRPELAVAEVAVMHLGAAGVALYPSSPPATIEDVLADSAPSALLVEGAMEPLLQRVGHSVPRVLALDAEGSAGRDRLASVKAPVGFDFEAAWRAVCAGDLAALIYTSGTTGRRRASSGRTGSRSKACVSSTRCWERGTGSSISPTSPSLASPSATAATGTHCCGARPGRPARTRGDSAPLWSRSARPDWAARHRSESD